jgi:type-2 restriction enzyme ageI
VKYYAVCGELAALVFKKASKNLDAVAQAACLRDSVQW